MTRGERNIVWLEKYLYIPEGEFVGKPVRLTDDQKEWIHQIYDSPTRTFILSMGRKNAKTALAAMLCLLHLAGPEARQNSQLYSGAQSRDQASIVFNYASKMVRMSPDLSDYILIREASKQLACPELGTLYRALSADASTNFGLSPVFIIHDELGQVQGPHSPLYSALETACAAHKSPLSIIISTQAPHDADLLSVLIDDALGAHDPRVKIALYQADDEVDAFSEEAIRAANPHYDVFMNRQEVLRQRDEAKRIPSSENSYRNLILNQRVQAEQPFISAQLWKDNGQPPVSPAPSGEVFAGLDLSSVSDLTALVLLSKSGEQWDVHPTFWLPGEGLAEKSRKDKTPWDVWANKGLLQTTPGRAIEYDYVAVFLKQLFTEYDIRTVAFDRAYMRFLKPCLSRAGFTDDDLEKKFFDFGQGFLSMGPAIRCLEAWLLEKKLRHGMHPVLTECAKNAVVEVDAAGSKKMTKRKSTGRIDGMIALAMAVERAYTYEQETSVYETREPVCL